jgi:peptidoglycan/xylan/chitin deacetylase (PgdA/CDA1 family)
VYHRHADGGDVVALTFDDGPGEYTPQILDTLQRHGARATFFVVGSRIHGWEPLLRRMLAEGHEIGNHSLTHGRLAGRPITAYRDIRAASLLVARMTGCAPRVFRPPFGTVTRAVLHAAHLAGLTTVKWNVDPRDWEPLTPHAISQHVLTRAAGGSIVVLHDGPAERPRTARAVELLLPALRARGCRLVTTSELIASTGEEARPPR